MRISSHQFHLNSIQNIQFNTKNFNEASVQMSTNQRINKPSDDPLGAVMLLNLDAELGELSQYESNMSAVNFNLGQQEVQLNAIVNQIYSLQSLITTAADGTMGTSELKALGQEMAMTFPAIVDALNATNSDGGYYFSGSETKTKPFTLDASGKYIYNGDDQVRNVAVSQDSSVPSNITGNNLDPDAEFLNAMQDYLQVITNPPAEGVGDQSRDMIDMLGVFTGTITSELTNIGGTLSSLDSLTISNEDISTFTTQLRDEVSTIDYPEAFIKLNESLAAYESSMKVYSRVTSLSLFSLI